MDNRTNTDGLLTLDTTTNTRVFNIAMTLPQQTIYLKSYRAEMSAAGTALSTKLLYVELPFVNSQYMLDGNIGRWYLPIMLDNATVSIETGLDLPIRLSGIIPETFTMNIYDKNFALVSNFVSLTLQFQLTRGSVG